MPELSVNQYNDFCAKLEGFRATLDTEQLALLDGILAFAWGAATEEEKCLTAGFTGSFTPKQAALILDYAAGAGGPVTMVPRLIKGFIRSDLH
jgi:hypothetical protein